MTVTLKGYATKQLRVNLNEQTVTIEEIRMDLLSDYLGGTGYAAKLLYDELKVGIDPLGPDNKMIFSTGPLTANKIPGGGSVQLCFKSPLTGGWGESRSGGDFGPKLRKAGYDHLIVEGRSQEPVYLLINNGKAVIRSGKHLVGKTVSEKRRILSKELSSSGFSIMCIGPGGERKVRYACAMINDRAAGRGGAGAVLGAKNLLAIAVKGTGSVEEFDPGRLKKILRQANQILKENPMSSGFRDAGTIGDLPANDDGGDWPTKNWQSNSWGKGTELYDHYESNNFIRPYACYRGCTISCGRKVKVAEGPYQTPEHGGAEYESISSFTAFVLNEDMDAAIHCTYLCNEYGLDTISAGAAIAFAMECYEKGILTEDDFGDIDPNWGRAAALPRFLEVISKREGIGDLLAEGVRAASKRLGKGAEAFAIHVKGMEGPAHDPRSGKSLGLAYGTANRGMCHIHPVEAMAWDSGKMDWGLKKYGLTDPEHVDPWDELDKGKDIRLLQDGLILPDILGTCKFFMYAGMTIDLWAEMLAAITGWQIDGWGLLKIGERVTNLQRLFNIREGFSRQDDLLPKRAISTPAFGKYSDQPECAIDNYKDMLREYYVARGWDPDTGSPTNGKLAELNLT